MRPFTYVVYYVRPDNVPSGYTGPKSQIISGPTTVLAKSDKAVTLMILNELGDEWKARIDNIEVAIRPF